LTRDSSTHSIGAHHCGREGRAPAERGQPRRERRRDDAFDWRRSEPPPPTGRVPRRHATPPARASAFFKSRRRLSSSRESFAWPSNERASGPNVRSSAHGDCTPNRATCCQPQAAAAAVGTRCDCRSFVRLGALPANIGRFHSIGHVLSAATIAITLRPALLGSARFGLRPRQQVSADLFILGRD
jgi:hypothetical protein